MNRTTSLLFTSLSIHCSMLILTVLSRSSCGRIVAPPSKPSLIYVAQDRRAPQGHRRLFLGRRVERSFHFAKIVLVEAVDLDDGARRIGPLPPQLLLHFIHERTIPVHVGHIDDQTDGIAQARPFRFGDQLHVEKSLADARLVARPACW